MVSDSDQERCAKTDMYGGRVEPELYNLSADPKQTRNLYDEEKDVAEELHSNMIQFLQSIGENEEFLRGWRRTYPTS